MRLVRVGLIDDTELVLVTVHSLTPIGTDITRTCTFSLTDCAHIWPLTAAIRTVSVPPWLRTFTVRYKWGRKGLGGLHMALISLRTTKFHFQADVTTWVPQYHFCLLTWSHRPHR